MGLALVSLPPGDLVPFPSFVIVPVGPGIAAFFLLATSLPYFGRRISYFQIVTVRGYRNCTWIPVVFMAIFITLGAISWTLDWHNMYQSTSSTLSAFTGSVIPVHASRKLCNI